MHIQYIKIYKEMILIFLFVSDDKIHVVYWNEIPITYVKHLHMYMSQLHMNIYMIFQYYIHFVTDKNSTAQHV